MDGFHKEVRCNLKSFKHAKYVVLKIVQPANSSTPAMHRQLCAQMDYWTRTHGSSMFHILTVRVYLWSRIKTIGQHMCHVLYFTDIFSSYSPIPHNRFSTFSTITYISRHVFKIVHIYAILVAWDAHIFNLDKDVKTRYTVP